MHVCFLFGFVVVVSFFRRCKKKKAIRATMEGFVGGWKVCVFWEAEAHYFPILMLSCSNCKIIDLEGSVEFYSRGTIRDSKTYGSFYPEEATVSLLLPRAHCGHVGSSMAEPRSQEVWYA